MGEQGQLEVAGGRLYYEVDGLGGGDAQRSAFMHLVLDFLAGVDARRGTAVEASSR